MRKPRPEHVEALQRLGSQRFACHVMMYDLETIRSLGICGVIPWEPYGLAIERYRYSALDLLELEPENAAAQGALVDAERLTARLKRQ